jgi:hypothetical protein
MFRTERSLPPRARPRLARGAVTAAAGRALAQRLGDEVLHQAALLDAEQTNAPLEFTRDTGVEADEWLG